LTTQTPTAGTADGRQPARREIDDRLSPIRHVKNVKSPMLIRRGASDCVRGELQLARLAG
jgi:hypothetical protein